MKQISRIKSLSTNTSGTASIEFAFIAPVFILLFLGSFVLFDTIRAKRIVSNSTIVVSDLVTRLVEVDETTLQDVYTAGDALLGEFRDNSSIDYTITSVTNPLGNQDDPVVVWSRSTDSALVVETADLQAFDLPSMNDGETMILVQAEGTVKPKLSFTSSLLGRIGMGASIDVDEVVTRRPRLVREICLHNANDSVICSNTHT